MRVELGTIGFLLLAHHQARPPQQKARGLVPDYVLNKKMYFTNNLPNIVPLEYGGYPQPVKLGSWDKKKKAYVKKSDGGFSKQAPGGWVRATLIAMRNKIKTL